MPAGAVEAGVGLAGVVDVDAAGAAVEEGEPALSGVLELDAGPAGVVQDEAARAVAGEEQVDLLV